MQVGDILPLQYQSPNYDNTKFPRAVIFDDTLAPVGSPVNLALISNGLYKNLSAFFPSGGTKWVAVSYLVYDDSSHTILSSSQPGDQAIFYLSGQPQALVPIPAVVQLADYDPTLFPRAILTDQLGAPIPGSPLNLASLGNGFYGNVGAQMPSYSPWVGIQYPVFTDGTYTVLSSTSGGGDAVVFLSPPPLSTLPSPTGLVGILDSLLVNPVNGIQDEIVTGSDRILNARLVRNDNGDPFDLTGATNVAFRFLNADMTNTVIQMTDPGAPVQVTSAQAGRLSCSITKLQTAALMPGSPAPFSVAVTQPAGDTVCNFPYQLQVSEEINQ